MSKAIHHPILKVKFWLTRDALLAYVAYALSRPNSLGWKCWKKCQKYLSIRVKPTKKWLLTRLSYLFFTVQGDLSIEWVKPDVSSCCFCRVYLHKGNKSNSRWLLECKMEMNRIIMEAKTNIWGLVRYNVHFTAPVLKYA